MDTCILGVIISREEYDEYIKLKQKIHQWKREKYMDKEIFIAHYATTL